MSENRSENRDRPMAQGMPNFGPGGPRRGGGPMAGRMNREKPKNAGKTLGRLFRYIGASRFLLFAMTVIIAVGALADLAGPAVQGFAIDCITVENGKIHCDLSAMGNYLILLGILVFVHGVLSFVHGILAAKLAQNTVYMLRRDLFRKISRLPVSYTDTHKHGDIMSRMTNDVENVSNVIANSLAQVVVALITLIGAAVMMIYYSWVLALVACVTIPVTMLVSTGLAKFMRRYFTRQQKLLGELNGEVEEKVTSFKTVAAYGREEESVAAFSETSEKLRETSIRSRVWGSVMGPCMNFLGNFQYVLIAAFGGLFVLNGWPAARPLTVGSIQSMLLYSHKFSRPVNELANQYASILTALAGAERIFAILDADDEVDEGREEFAPERFEGEIRFENIRFGYVKDEPVLKGLDLTVKPGQKIAIVGATGSGKTTVVNLLTRFYETDGGRITVDGVDIRDIPKNDLRRAVAIVLQDTVLFSDTIRKNLTCGREGVAEEDILRAADLAGARHFVERLPDGFDTVLAESGQDLSAGQRQLLSIARAVLADPKILILDEATSSVDTRTEMRIQQAMVRLMENRTSLIIAHRLSTIRDADVIVVIKNGVVYESGSHEELLEKHGEYYTLYSNQFAGIAT